MKRDKDREKLIAKCLHIGYKTDNINYMDWNTVDWHLKDNKLPYVFKHLSTIGERFGYVTIGGRDYEYTVAGKDKVTVKQVKTGDSNGLPRSTTAS